MGAIIAPIVSCILIYIKVEFMSVLVLVGHKYPYSGS